MSLQSERKYRIGIIMSKGFDDPDFLPNRLGPHAGDILIVSTNGVNPLVTEFCQANGIIYTVYPISRTAPWSNSRIIESSDKVYILTTAGSHNAGLAVKECEKQGKKFEIVEREQVFAWKDKVSKAREVLDAIPEEDIKSSVALNALRNIL